MVELEEDGGGFEGTREDKEEEQKEKNTTKRTREILDVFVRNLPHSTTDESLENAFSEIGLVRQAWVAREKGTHVHRGFGYVTFSMKEDVEEALKLNMKMEIEGRKIGILRSKEKEKVDFKERKRLKREMREEKRETTKEDEDEDGKEKEEEEGTTKEDEPRLSLIHI